MFFNNENNFYRDTPHHLKNKRVQQSVDKGANAILTNAMKFREKTPPLTQQSGLPPVSAAAAREEHAQLEAIKSGDEEASPSQEGKFKFTFTSLCSLSNLRNDIEFIII